MSEFETDREKPLTATTLLPIGLAVAIFGGGSAWLTTISWNLASASQEIASLKKDQAQYMQDVQSIKTDIAVIKNQVQSVNTKLGR